MATRPGGPLTQAVYLEKTHAHGFSSSYLVTVYFSDYRNRNQTREFETRVAALSYAALAAKYFSLSIIENGMYRFDS